MPEFSFDRWFRLEVATASIHLVAFFTWYALSREGHHSWWMGFSLARLVYAALAMVLLDANLDDPDTQYSLYVAMCAWYLAGLAILELAILKNIRTISSVTASMARKCRHIKTSKYLLFSALVLFIVAASLLGTITSPILPKIGAILYRVGIIILLVWYLGTLPLCGLLLFWDIRKKLSTTESVMLWGLLASVPFMIILLVFQLIHTHGILVVFNTTFAHHVSLAMVMEFVVVALNLVAAWINERLEAKFAACAVFVISTIADIAELSLTEDSFLLHTGSSLVTVISIDTLKLALGPAFFSRQAIISRVAQRACLEISVYPGHRQSLFGKTQYFLDIERSHERILKYVADQIPGTLLNVDEGTLVSTAAINAIRHFRHLTERLCDEEDRVQGNPEIEAQLKSKVMASMTTSTAVVMETEVDKGSSDSLALQVRNPNWEVQLHERDLPVELRNRPRVYEIENGPSTENAVTLYSSEIAARNAAANSNKFKRLTQMPEHSLSRTSAALPP